MSLFFSKEMLIFFQMTPYVIIGVPLSDAGYSTDTKLTMDLGGSVRNRLL